MTRLIGSLAAVVLVLAACSSSTPAEAAATPDPTIAFCAALDTYAGTLATLDALTPTATVDDYKTAGRRRQGRPWPP